MSFWYRFSPSGNEVSSTPVLVDFGLAGRHIRPGCATGPYGAPEIWGLTPEDWKPRPMPADVYAFACMAYEVLTGDTLFVALNAQPKAADFQLPATNPGQHWELLFDTADDARPAAPLGGKPKYKLRDWSAAVFRTRPDVNPTR